MLSQVNGAERKLTSHLHLYLCYLYHHPGLWKHGSGWRRAVQTAANPPGNRRGAPGVPCLRTPSGGWRWAGDHTGWWMPVGGQEKGNRVKAQFAQAKYKSATCKWDSNRWFCTYYTWIHENPTLCISCEAQLVSASKTVSSYMNKVNKE